MGNCQQSKTGTPTEPLYVSKKGLAQLRKFILCMNFLQIIES